ncbi:MAG: GntR family transcriptional regulator [Anaerolineales bacterium]|nr:MAG: GntR family transcriptional regulator [Anaerolineales bacterium]
MKRHNSKSQYLQEKLSQLIAMTKPGERLPSEPALAKDLGVSRATLREAMRTFETQGLIRRRQGSGTYVTHPTQVFESGLEMLESIETMAKRIGLEVQMGEMKVFERPATFEETEALNLKDSANVTHVSRVIHVENRPVAYLIDIVPVEMLEMDDFEEDFTGSVLDLFLEHGKPMLISSRCEIKAVSAPVEVAKLLGIQRRDVLLSFVAYLYASDGRVVDYSYSYFLPGYFHFHVIRKVG